MSAIEQISCRNKNDFKKLKIINGTLKYFKNLKYPGYGIGFNYKKEERIQNPDLFLDFSSRNIKKDRTSNYTIKYYNIKIDRAVKFKETSAGIFNSPANKVIISVDHSNFLSNKVDLGSFSFDFFISPALYNTKNRILKKGIFYDNKFYGVECKIEDKKILINLDNFFYNIKNKSYYYSIK